MSGTALITGVGPGLGAALARRFAREGLVVGLLARSPEFVTQLADELNASGHTALPLVCDVGQPDDVSKAVAKLRETHGPITTLIHNASAALGDGLQGTTPEDFEASWRATTLGGFTSARETVPDMLAAGGGTMLFTGATSSVRGGGWLAFSSAKFALRGMIQSMARELWPQGIHIAHVVVDGIITAPGDAETDEPELDPTSMANAYWHLANQERSAWTLELDLRPNREEFFV